MKRKRRQHSGAFKAKVGLEAVIGIKTIAQIAREYEVHPMLVTQWKTTLRERMPEVFERGGEANVDQERLIAKLHQKIGELSVDLDWLKKKSRQLGLSLRDVD
jgi:transposase-like protein